MPAEPSGREGAGSLRLAVLQFAPVLGDAAANGERIAAAGAGLDAELLVTPELALTGYDVGDEAAGLALALDEGPAAVAGLQDVPAVVLGLIERGRDGTPYNAAAVLRRGQVVFRHRKVYLPTYGMFDEARFFGRGRAVRATDIAGWRVGILICEDFWHPALAYLLAAQGLELLVVPAAAPGRDLQTGDVPAPSFASWDAWERIARTTAQLYGVFVAVANRIGSEGGITFGGGSLVVGPTGDVMARADPFSETALQVDLERAELERARRPYSHARDDDPLLTLEELRRVIADREAAGG